MRSVAVEPGNEWFATGSADRTIKIWDLASGQLKLTLTGHIEQVFLPLAITRMLRCMCVTLLVLCLSIELYCIALLEDTCMALVNMLHACCICPDTDQAALLKVWHCVETKRVGPHLCSLHQVCNIVTSNHKDRQWGTYCCPLCAHNMHQHYIPAAIYTQALWQKATH